MSLMFETPIEPMHPVFPALTQQQALAILAEHGEAKLAEVLRVRNAAIRAEKEDPLRSGFELPTWLLADVLMGFITWAEFCHRIRKLILIAWREDVAEDLSNWLENEMFAEAVANGPYRLLQILGGNQAAKTEYIIKRLVEQLDKFAGMRAWVFHENGPMSRDYHQTRFDRYAPEKWKTAGKGQVGYYSYKLQTGFPDGLVTGPNGSQAVFKNYEMKENAMEGGELGDPARRRALGWVTDELVPYPLLMTLRMRLTRLNAAGICAFTPKYGYTPVVGWFLDGARTVLSAPGRELRSGKEMPLVRIGREDGETGIKKATINFHSIYNPYPARDSYQDLVDMVKEDSDATRAIRLYGHCENKIQELFGKLSETDHGFWPSVEIMEGMR